MREYSNSSTPTVGLPEKRTESNADLETVATANSEEVSGDADVLTFANGL